MKSYEPAPQEVQDRLVALMQRFYPDLCDLKLRVDLLMASTDTEDAHAVTLNGYPCQAVVKIIGLKERVKGLGDAEIVIDRDNYESLDNAERDALLDHELYHLEPQKRKSGGWKRDDAGRPVLKMRKHDRQFGWFDAIARRHGDASAEVIQFRAFEKEAGQLYLGLTFIDSAIGRLRPSDETSVSIRVPSANVGVTITKDGATRTDGAGNPVTPAAQVETFPAAQEGGENAQLTNNEPAANPLPEPPPAQPSAEAASGAVIHVTDAEVDAALKIITELDRASVSTLQRRMRIGYNHANEILNELERRGHVGPENGTGPREILKAKHAA